MRIKKKKKSVNQRGRTTYGHGARKKWKKSGHKGGIGMAGTGKRADHKKTLINKLYGNKYFGKQGITSKGTKRDKRKRINISDIEKNIEKFSDKNGWLDLSEYKVLGDGEITKKLKIKALEVSKSAKKKIEKAGGEIIVNSVSKNSDIESEKEHNGA